MPSTPPKGIPITRRARVMDVTPDPDTYDSVPTLTAWDETSKVSGIQPTGPVLPPTGDLAAGSATWGYEAERAEPSGRAGATAIVTVRLHRLGPRTSAACDGVPEAVVPENSGKIYHGEVDGPALDLHPADVWQILANLAELAFHHGHGDIVEYPVLTRERGVSVLVLRWKAFNRWLTTLADHPVPFGELGTICATCTARVRNGAVPLVKMIRRLAPALREHDTSDNPYFMLDVSGLLEHERYAAAERELAQQRWQRQKGS